MVAVRPNFHQPALFAKQAANIDNIAGGRLALNVVSSWWAKEAQAYGLQFDQHDDRYAPHVRMAARWSMGCGAKKRFSFEGECYTARTTRSASPSRCASRADDLRGRRERGGQDDDRDASATPTSCTATRSRTSRPKIADMAGAARGRWWPPMQYGMAAYAIVRDSEAEAKRELERITQLPPEPPAGFANFDQWLSGTQLERELKIQEYSVSNRGLRPNLVGTPEQVQERIAEYEAAGLDLLLLQMSPQAEEMERFAAQVIQPMRAAA